MAEVAKTSSGRLTEAEAGASLKGLAPVRGRARKEAEHLSAGILRQLEKREAAIHKVAVAQIKALPTRLEENYEKICTYIKKADDAGAQLVVFPELAIPGYLCLDLFNRESFVQANLAVLERLVRFTQGLNVTAIVGFVNSELDEKTGVRRHYNAAAVIRNGKLLDVIDKTLLPDYDIFWETRYFASAKERRPAEVEGRKIGIGICEDLWDKQYTIKVNDELKERGAEMLVNLSASPFDAGKYRTRYDLASGTAKKQGLPLIYANLVGVQDGYEGEVVFDGRSMIVAADGSLMAIGKQFEEDLLLVDLHEPKQIALPDWSPIEEIHDALILAIRDYCTRYGFKRVYIGMSGGVDSALTAALAVEALGPENVVGVTMPSHITSEETKGDALLQASTLGMRCDVVPIGSIYKAYEEEALRVFGKLDPITKQNIQARIRGNILMGYSNQDRQGIVVSTGNKTEMGVGYCTLYGDMSGGLALIADISKSNVYELCTFINNRAGRELIPGSVIARAPTAELEPGQTDEANLPAPYRVLSPLVDDLVEQPGDLSALTLKYPREAVAATARLIRRNEFKRRQAAPGVRATAKAYGAGRRCPVDDQFDELSFAGLEEFRRGGPKNAKEWVAEKDCSDRLAVNAA